MVASADQKIVIVDDDEDLLCYIGETLGAAGYKYESFGDAISALNWLASPQQNAKLLLSDINMPGMSGLELLRTVKTVSPDLPFILLSGQCDFSSTIKALRAGATDYLLKPAPPDVILSLIRKHLNGGVNSQFLAAKATLAGFLDSKNLSGGFRASQLIPILDLLGLKRFETLQHSRRVAAFSLLIGRQMKLETRELEALEIGSLLHDVGKAAIPHNVLMKPGKLTAEELTIMRMHAELGWELLAVIPGMDLESQIVYAHHEWFDGSGYPRQLSRESIPLGARIFSVADTLDAITSDRCYRKARPLSTACTEIERMAQTQFDPDIVEKFRLISHQEIEEIRERLRDIHGSDISK